MGRPSTYTPENVELICSKLIEGQSLRSICEAKNTPHISTVIRWLTVHEDFQVQYARARQAQAYRWAEEILQIADDAEVDNAAIQKARLQVDTRKWLLSKLIPKQYGNKANGIQLANGPEKIQITWVEPDAQEGS